MTAALIAGLLGLAFAALADRLSLVLPIQVQAWRTLALMAILAGAGLAVCVRELSGRGPAGVLAVCALIVGWTHIGWGAVPMIAAVAALGAFLIRDRDVWSTPKLTQRIAIGLTSVLLLAWAVVRFKALRHGLALLPAGQGVGPGLIWNSGLPGWLAAATALVLAARPTLLKTWSMALGATVLAILALALWDNRSGFVRQRDSGPDAALQAMLAQGPGEVLWLAGDVEPWALARRPSWASKFQGAGVVLSRPLAMVLNDRVDRLIAVGLAGEDWRAPFRIASSAPVVPTSDQVSRFCATADAPAWIVAPLTSGATVDPALRSRTWTPRAPYELDLAARWFVADRYAVIPCAGP